MKKTTLSLIVAGALGLAGIAQAETYNTPMQAGEASTMTMGQPNQLTTNSPYGDNTVLVVPSVQEGVVVDTTTMGAGPNMMGHSVYVQPGWHGGYHQRHEAAGTFNTPSRAGEASTMTGGQPNMLTDNSRLAADHAVNVWSVPSNPYSAPQSIYYGS
jgi:hypothetical protein